MQTPSFKGQKSLQDQSNDYNTKTFHIKQEISKLNTTLPVEIMAVNTEARISPVGRVDVKPMIDQMDGSGKSVPHGTIYNVPYMRMQGGLNAFIIDPQVGDIGICCFADRDISRFKETKESSLPGSKRMMSMADALYIGGILNGTPERYIIIDDDGIEINGNQLVYVTADAVSVECANAEIIGTSSINMEAPTIEMTAATSISMTAPTINITGATAVNIVSSTIINLTSLILASTGVLTALDFATAIIASLNAHGHVPGTFAAGGDAVTGKSGVPS